KTASWVQDRIGPNRVGLDFGLPFMPKFHFWGLGQPLADGLKFLMKEDYDRKDVDKVLFTLAPVVMIIVVIISIAVIPWGGVRQVSKVVTVDADRMTPTAFEETASLGELSQDAEQAIRFYLPYDAQFAERVDPDTIKPNNVNGVVESYSVPVTYRYHFQIAHLNIGVLFVLAALSLAVYGVVVGGWASNNKYSFLGGLRATANMISYEIPLGMTVLVLVIMFGTLDLAQIVDRQATYWWVAGILPIPSWNMFVQPLAFLLFLICIHAEANRAPFDMAEAEQELVGGYHTEYSSMRFALFFLAEYAGMITTSCVLVALFWGGWHMPYLDFLIGAVFPGIYVEGASNSVTTSLLLCIVHAGVLFGKALLVMFIFMWVRWSLPRFRFDQLMQLAWKGLIPIMLVLIVVTTLTVYFTGGETYNGVSGNTALIFLGTNVVAMAIIVIGSKLIPAGANQNTRVAVPGSRFGNTPMPAGVTRRPMKNEQSPHRMPGMTGATASGAALGGGGHAGLVSYDADAPKT
ncbi:MAG: NADH-quinone oxidoreductase subunit H, partial [Planctomycetota bacterium]